MTTVSIGPPLRKFCDGKEELSGEGTTILDVLKDMSVDHPELRSRILRSETEISARIFVYRDGAVVIEDRETVPLGPGERLRLYAFVAGG